MVQLRDGCKDVLWFDCAGPRKQVVDDCGSATAPNQRLRYHQLPVHMDVLQLYQAVEALDRFLPEGRLGMVRFVALVDRDLNVARHHVL